MTADVTPTPEPRGPRTTSLIRALRRHRGVLTVTGISVAVVFLLLTALDLLHLIDRGGVHVSAAVKAPFLLIMLVCIGLVVILAIADNADEASAKSDRRADR